MLLNDLIGGAVNAIEENNSSADRYTIFVNGEYQDAGRFFSVELIFRYAVRSVYVPSTRKSTPIRRTLNGTTKNLYEIWITTHELTYGENSRINDVFVLTPDDMDLEDQFKKAELFVSELPLQIEELNVRVSSSSHNDVYAENIQTS